MELQLKNIGMIKEANVKIDGLTVIAGENDTGKSTVGKVVFCIIKAISRYEEDFQESKYYKVGVILERLFFYLRRNINLDDDLYIEIKNILDINYFEKMLNNNKTEEYIDKIKNYVSNINNQTFNSRLIEERLLQLENIIKLPEDKQSSIESALNKVFRSEFNSDILTHGCENGFIKLYENSLLLLDIVIHKNNKIELKNEVEPIEIKEATFIETPLILNNHDLLIRSQTGLELTKRSSRRLGIPYTTLHTKDLFDKLKSENFDLSFDNEFECEIREEISNIINGEIVYDDDEKDFIYIKNGNKVAIKNTATGIKAFGIIQLLIENGFIDRTSLLILDEPEIHLHPKWQLQYAQIITTLVKYDIPVMVTSHSPYMIQALIKYAKNSNISDKSNFYLIDKDDELAESKNVNNSINEIFELLAKPMNEIY